MPSSLSIKSDQAVDQVFQNYPDSVRPKMLALRELVVQAAKETDGITELEETLKWGEPSYLTKKGSTLRMDWKPRSPDHYALYFKCTSKLVEPFVLVFDQTFSFEGKRAIVFHIEDQVPRIALKQCIQAALTYHRVKHLPMLGMVDLA